MGKYAKYQRKSPAKGGLHPIWRGIGCILIIVVPWLSYWLMVVIVPQIIATGKVPYQLLGYIRFPEWAFRYRIIAGLAGFFSSLQNPWINMITFFVILLILTSIASLVYATIYKVIGPARYTELDAPPTKYKTKVYKR